MKKKQKIDVYDYQLYYSPLKNTNILVLMWGWKGFGQTIIDYNTMEVLDDENMGVEFCNEVIKIAFEKFEKIRK